MIRTFPNLKTVDKDGNILYFDSLLPDIQPYYYKFEKSIKTSLVEIITGTDKEEWEE